MGHSERVVQANFRERQAREWAELMDEVEPEGLTQTEVDLERHPLTKTPKPQAVGAWVRHRGRPVWVKGYMSMWTDQACKVRWLTPKLRWREAWVWAGAVEPRTMVQGEENNARVGISVNAAPPGSEPRPGFK